MIARPAQNSKLRIHCVGVKGIGLSALAQVLAAHGHHVSGSDVSEPFPADAALRRAGIRIYQGFAAYPVLDKRIDLIIVSSAYLSNYGGRTAIVQEAIRRRIPILSYPEAVAGLFNKAKWGVAVAGSHGKSTTSALLGVMLEALGYDPTVITGAVVKNWNSNARISRGRKALKPYGPKAFVLEADEYRDAFLNYQPKGAIITSVDWDHPDVFPTAASYRSAFRAFTRRVDPKGVLVVYGDDPIVREIGKNSGVRRVITYGLEPHNALRISSVTPISNGISFHAAFRKKPLGAFAVQLYGKHHALNAAAVIALCFSLGESLEHIRKALRAFRGTMRRFQILTPKPYTLNPIIIDDYAHHPTELRATIAAARETFPHRRIRVLFQPHTFSRTKAFFNDFVAALNTADEAAVLKTYGSARESSSAARNKHRGGRSEDLARALHARHFATHRSAIAFYQKSLHHTDVLLALGAGDGDHVASEVAKSKKSR